MTVIAQRAPEIQESPEPLLDTIESKIWIVLPAYNEEQGLGELLQKIRRQFESPAINYEVIVVDDASQDRTGEIASQHSFHMPLRLKPHSRNQGLAGALRTGLNEALAQGRPGDVIITLDADNTQQPGTMSRLLQMISDGYDVVIASRFQPGSRVLGVPANRRLMTWCARQLFRTLLPIPGVRDYTSGYRAYRYTALREAADAYGEQFVSEKGFSCMVDVLLKMRHFGTVFGEVPMLLRYDQKQGASKMNVRRTATQTIRLLLRRRFEPKPELAAVASEGSVSPAGQTGA
jgi:dolichol-phosphate mannosyltransferase